MPEATAGLPENGPLSKEITPETSLSEILEFINEKGSEYLKSGMKDKCLEAAYECADVIKEKAGIRITTRFSRDEQKVPIAKLQDLYRIARIKAEIAKKNKEWQPGGPGNEFPGKGGRAFHLVSQVCSLIDRVDFNNWSVRINQKVARETPPNPDEVEKWVSERIKKIDNRHRSKLN